MIPLDRVQAALLLFAGAMVAAYVIGLVLAYCRRRPVLENLKRQTWGRK